MSTLPESEIAYHPLSFLDKAGRLFTWQGELYRGINPSEEPRIRHLFDSGLIPRLVEALPAGRIESLSMHRPTLSDVFVKLTGRSLRDEAARAAVEA